jgi:hypothetical protein
VDNNTYNHFIDGLVFHPYIILASDKLKDEETFLDADHTKVSPFSSAVNLA